MNNNDLELARIIEQSYNKETIRKQIMFFDKNILILDEQDSNWLWATYSDENVIVIAVHGFDNVKVNFTKLLSDKFFNNEENNKLFNRFVKLFQKVRFDKRRTVFTGHSLGCWIIAKAEVEVGFSNNRGVFFGPYTLGDNKAVVEFINNTTKYKKIYYQNDITTKQLKNPTNSVILQPKEPMQFINSHGLFNFTRPLNQINKDVKTNNSNEKFQEIPEKQKKQKVEEIKSTNLSILSYNVKMFDRLLSNLRNEFRAKEISRRIMQLNPDVIAFQELFDNESERVFKNHLKGYAHSKKVGGNVDLFSGKLIDGGVILFSKFPIENEKQIVYKHSTKDDKLSSKGAVRIKIMKNEIPIHIIATHLQSGRKQEALDVKVKQIGQVNKLVNENEPTIIVGDWNINTNNNQLNDFFNTQTNKHGLTRHSPSGNTTNENFSQDDSKNTLDHALTNNLEKWNISVSSRILKDEFTVKGGYKVREEGLFEFRKKTKKKILRKLKFKKTKKEKFFTLSDHHGILFNVDIKSKKLLLGRDGI